MEIRQLKQFLALAETLNFHRAAEALHISQPPLSLSIRRLEEELGAELFVRHPRGVSLTEAGKATVAPARAAILAVENLVEVAREGARGERGRVCIGFVSSATYALVPALVARFHARYPNVELSLKEMTGLEALRGLEDGTLDAGLVRTPVDQTRVALTPLPREPFILLAPFAHPLSSTGTVPLEDLHDQPFVLYDRDHTPGLRAQLLLSCEAAGFRPRVVEEATHVNTIIALVEGGLGLAFVPAVIRRAAEGRARCLDLTLNGQPLWTRFALALRRGEARPVVEALRAIVCEEALAIQD